MLKTSPAGRPPALCPTAQVLVTLEYWREYRSYFHISTDWGVSESTVCRYVHQVEKALIQSSKFHLPGKKRLFKGFGTPPKVVVMDVTETPIERPKRRQKHFYSGKKRQHTLIATRHQRRSDFAVVGRSSVKSFWMLILMKSSAPILAKDVVMILPCSRRQGFIFILRP